MVRMSLTNGTPVLVGGRCQRLRPRRARSSCRAEASPANCRSGSRRRCRSPWCAPTMPISMSSFTIIACLMSGAFLMLALQYVRRSQAAGLRSRTRDRARRDSSPTTSRSSTCRTGALAGCEVLCRWEKKNGEVVPPGAFIDYAEVTGLAIPMTLSLMQQVRRRSGRPLPRDAGHEDLDQPVRGALPRRQRSSRTCRPSSAARPIAFRQLVFEITERHPLGNSAGRAAVIAGLPRAGRAAGDGRCRHRPLQPRLHADAGRRRDQDRPGVRRHDQVGHARRCRCSTG